MIDLAVLLCGFSIFSALLLALTHFAGESYRDQRQSRDPGLLLLLTLGGLQLVHFAWLGLGLDWVSAWPYRLMLFRYAGEFRVSPDAA